MDPSTLGIDLMCGLNLGTQGLAAITQALHLGICMTCTRPMTGLPSLVVDCYGHDKGGYASLHHGVCCPPQWRYAEQAPAYVATCSITYALLDNEPAPRAVMILNPMLESVLIVPGAEQWYPALHPQYTEAGMVPADDSDLPPRAPGMRVTVEGRSMYLTDGLGRAFPDRPEPVPADVLHAARTHGNVLAAVTQAIDPLKIRDAETMLQTVYHPMTLVGLVDVFG